MRFQVCLLLHRIYTFSLFIFSDVSTDSATAFLMPSIDIWQCQPLCMHQPGIIVEARAHINGMLPLSNHIWEGSATVSSHYMELQWNKLNCDIIVTCHARRRRSGEVDTPLASLQPR